METEIGRRNQAELTHFSWPYLTADGPVLERAGNHLVCFHENEEPVLVSDTHIKTEKW